MQTLVFSLYVCVIFMICFDRAGGFLSRNFGLTRISPSKATFLLHSTPTGDANTPAAPTPVVMKSAIKAQLMEDMKDAMRKKEKQRLAAIRSVQAAVKQKEVDDQIEATDEIIIAIMTKLVKLRKESIQCYAKEGRQELVAAEQAECEVILQYLPQQLTEEELSSIISEAVEKVGAKTVKDMGKVVAIVKPLVMGKTDMAKLGDLIRKRLSVG